MTGALLALVAAALVQTAPPPSDAEKLLAGYVARYFAFYPSRATEAGRHDFDQRLEDPTPARRAEWLAFQKETLAAIAATRVVGPTDDEADLELLERQVAREIHDLSVRRRPERDPLWWTGIIGNATVFLLVRDDAPERERRAGAVARAGQIPRLAAQAREALAATPGRLVSKELTAIAARQARASSEFYRRGFVEAVGGAKGASASAQKAAAALEQLAAFLEGWRVWGSPALHADYTEAFRIATGVTTHTDRVLEEAQTALRAKTAEAAAYGRGVWGQFFQDPVPTLDREVLARFFARVAEDRASTIEEFVQDYRDQIAALERFLREHDVVTLPETTLWTGASPPFFVGQSVGGVYPAGPFAPDAKTLFYVPAPSPTATPEERETLFRAFNHHFNVMITPHEIFPGHYLQFKRAAQSPRKARALFADGVTVEGWGTFCERLLLDLGWGGPLDRMAHYKKQLENVARAIVDIRVHTKGWGKDEVVAFVRDEALQDPQFAGNMWMRSISTPTQITTYWLGDRKWRDLFEDYRALRGRDFRVKEFVDRVMGSGPIPIARVRERLMVDFGDVPAGPFLFRGVSLAPEPAASPTPVP
ncbi:MAG TPA: DUF885 domain-containing protein [Thermoanaerobaculia bacterium]